MTEEVKKRALGVPDHTQCEALKPNPRYSPFSFGPTPKRIRCTEVPTAVVKEIEAGEDDQFGSMSLCDDCTGVLAEQMPGYAIIDYWLDGRRVLDTGPLQPVAEDGA